MALIFNKLYYKFFHICILKMYTLYNTLPTQYTDFIWSYFDDFLAYFNILALKPCLMRPYEKHTKLNQITLSFRPEFCMYQSNKTTPKARSCPMTNSVTPK